MFATVPGDRGRDSPRLRIMSDTASFVHLRVHSAYSLAEGAIRVKDLVKTCAGQHMPACAITDTNNLFGALEFAQSASGAGVQPVYRENTAVQAEQESGGGGDGLRCGEEAGDEERREEEES